VPVVMIPGLMFQVEMQQWFPAAYGVARQALWLALIIVLYLAGASLIWVVAGRLTVAAVEGALNWRAGAKRVRGGWNFDWEQASTLVRHGLPLSISAFAIWIYLRIDQVMLHRMVNDYALGQYVAAVRISELTETLPSAIGFAIFPVLCAAAADRQRFQAYTATVFRILIFSSCALSLAVFLSANFIVTKYYGVRFAAAAPLLRVLIWSEIAVFFSGVVTTALLARAKEELMLYPSLAGAALNVLLNLWFIPRWGAVGACWATLISYAISSTLVLFIAEQGRDLLATGWKYLAPGILAIAAAVSVVKFTPIENTSRAFLGAAVFCALATVFRLVVPGDFERIRSLYLRLRGRPFGSGDVQEI
jgi:O-antigen/teichoic acid export membrane protein